jgi:hypothetical protein
LRPWRWASATIALIALPAIVAALAFVFVFDRSYRVWAYVAAGTIVALEVVKWAIDHEALRRVPNLDLEELYASVPLDRRGRQVVLMNLVTIPLAAVGLLLIATTTFDVDLAVAIVFIVVLGTTSFPTLLRVWRRNSWLAVSRIPTRPRRALQRSS